ncbi:helix-hairpin-helix domain-containing protein [Bacillus sp. FJAT-29790]|uniref:helix-hairpin-helix domain-containing protein n=1 Tax=Bacillus sp. FJAT-29790 TaxID=1895002 RepID=UPI001C21E835|nr:helix-hairpin-helix domain-containing protein [Bacillus sp. FJAT-29790]MBU8879461.1 helix-hairpin-helix domain-containing protein [Bacillus sp. FJAT-29790]
MIDWIKSNKAYISGGIVIIFAVIYFIFEPMENESSVIKNDEEWLGIEEQNLNENAEMKAVAESVIVDVKGAVNKPGVYKAGTDERVIDMINKAGGLTEKADEAKINFAMRVEDEMVVYVPAQGEVLEESGSILQGAVPASQGGSDGKVNLNTANETELQTLPGIGPAKAAAIIEFREMNGPFKVIEDIKSISGIGNKTFEKLQNSIKVK